MAARGSHDLHHLIDGQPAGRGEEVGAQLGRVEDVQVHVDVDPVHAGGEIGEGGVEAVQALHGDSDDPLPLDQVELRRIEVAGSDVDQVAGVERVEAGEL